MTSSTALATSTEAGTTSVVVRRSDAELVTMAEGLAEAARSARTLDAYRAWLQGGAPKVE